MPPKGAKSAAEETILQEEITFERKEQEEQCDRIFKDFTKAFRKLQRTSNADQIHAKIKEITSKLKEAKVLIKDFEREARADGMPAGELAARKKQLAAQLNDFIKMKDAFKQSEGSKADPLNGANGEIEMGLAGMSMQQLIAKGRNDMVETDKALERAQRVAADTIAIGTNVAAAVHDQTEQLGGIMDGLHEIEFTMKKASKVIRDITRGLLTDKCIAFLLLLVVCGVVAIIVVKVIDPKKAKQGAEAIVANATTALNNTSIGNTVLTGAQNTLNQTQNVLSGARRLLAQKALVHLLERNSTK